MHLHSGVHPRGNDARCVIEISGGGEKSLEILYNVMQRPSATIKELIALTCSA